MYPLIDYIIDSSPRRGDLQVLVNRVTFYREEKEQKQI